MSATPKKMAQPRNSQPSTLMPEPLPSSAHRAGLPRASVARADRLALGRVPASAHIWVMQVEGGALRPDPRDRDEVVPRRRAGRGPLQRVGEAPRVVLDDLLPVLPGLVDVVEEEQVRDAEYERADRRDLVQRRGEWRQQRVHLGAPWLANHAKPVLNKERRVEPDEHEPEVPLAKRVIE